MPHWNCILLNMGLNDCCTVGWNLVQWWPVANRNMGNAVLQFAKYQVRIKSWFAMYQTLLFFKMSIMNNQVQSYQLWLLSGHKLQLAYLGAYLVDNDTENHQFRCSCGLFDCTVFYHLLLSILCCPLDMILQCFA